MNRPGAGSPVHKAIHLALIELAEVFEDYRAAVVVGGNVPYLLVPQDREPHEGTADIDIVLAETGPYDDVLTLREVLERRLYQQDAVRPYRYSKGYNVGEQVISVLIEFLSGGVPPPSGMRRIGSEDIHVSVIEGLESAHKAPVTIGIPSTARTLRIASMPAFLAMKAMALDRREPSHREKDAYDIVYCLRNYPGGVEAVAAECAALMHEPAIRSGLDQLRTLFATERASGPVAYAKRSTDALQAALLRAEAFARVQDLLELLPFDP